MRSKGEVYPAVISILEKLTGKATEERLIDELKSMGIVVNSIRLSPILMKLEINGMIRVLAHGEEPDKRLVELIKH